MINFAQAQYLFLILLIPFFFVLYALLLHIKKKKVRRLGDPALVSRLMPSVSRSKGWWKVVVFSIAFFFFANA